MSWLPRFASVFVLLSVPAVQAQRVEIRDDTDWWSTLGSGSAESKDAHPSSAAPPRFLFAVLGASLGEAQFQLLASKVGAASHVVRGDASTSREQVCYESAQKPGAVHLILERGEVTYSFSLFEGGSPWNGSQECRASARISRGLRVGPLHLGQTRAQVAATLGKPTVDRGDRMEYQYLFRKKTGADSLDVSAVIVARFTNARLTYLSVSRSETF